MDIQYRLISEKDLSEVVKVHKKVFPHYFLTSLGDFLLLNYYKEYLNEDPDLFYGAFSGEELVGFSLGLMHDTSKAMTIFEQKFKKQLSRRLLLLCLRLDPKAISRCFKYLFLRKKQDKKITNRGTYLVFGVLPSFRDKHIASTITYFLFKAFSSRGVGVIYTATNTNNVHTNDFWKKKGASFVTKEGGHNYYSIGVADYLNKYEEKHGQPSCADSIGKEKRQ